MDILDAVIQRDIEEVKTIISQHEDINKQDAEKDF